MWMTRVVAAIYLPRLSDKLCVHAIIDTVAFLLRVNASF